MRFSTTFLAFAGLGVLVCAVILPACQQTEETAEKPLPIEAVAGADPKAPEVDTDGLAQFVGYRSWYRVNPEPIGMTDVVALMCANLTAKAAAEMRAKDPHIAVQEQKSFTVFVNGIGKDRLMGSKKGEFPVGTIIVKEKHNGSDASTSELLTVMIKRKKGFSPEIGDWEFLVLEGFAKSVQGRGAMEVCISCHTAVEDNDFVYADYVEGRESVPTKHFTTEFAADRP